jgi:hypothetical protein
MKESHLHPNVIPGRASAIICPYFENAVEVRDNTRTFGIPSGSVEVEADKTVPRVIFRVVTSVSIRYTS